MDITVIRAGRGDCIWIRWEDQCVHNIIIDSGPAATKAIFRRLIQQEITSKGEAIDLLVLTHIDDDHIRGFLYYLADYYSSTNANTFREVWFNTGICCLSCDHSPNSAAKLSCKLNNLGIHYSDSVLRGDSISIGDVTLKVICPFAEAVGHVNKIILQQQPSLHAASINKPLEDILANDCFQMDSSDTNKASIAMVLTYCGKYRIAFLGDAHEKEVREGLVEFFPGQAMNLVKLSHHGSSHNLSNELIDILNTRQYILSSSRDMDIITLARLYQKVSSTKETTVIYSNYSQLLAKQRLVEAGNKLLKIETLDAKPQLLWKEGDLVCRIRTIR
ncbi:ComEC/Rec2 family competence protein [Ruminiclostridium cellulolyticum]|uniref:Hydrolase (Metallo-beta-lactamase superfamily)-like protein n=1 Tax=Ruminiclostridium cellulolyticum (strain ATCC 35319 / DSM 5812 / JCM 6584 / H10) TaxID=394503 RepID=B8I496_RUMCH|nr:MBL fold metallo-hydrolase [Ruminiclostridium cellulolyticum]ACL74450.1 hydrolase (metallo-beta-lactamase superfamily)-like protein [Ruminiclostridium cellulolyticum H10]